MNDDFNYQQMAEEMKVYFSVMDFAAAVKEDGQSVFKILFENYPGAFWEFVTYAETKSYRG